MNDLRFAATAHVVFALLTVAAPAFAQSPASLIDRAFTMDAPGEAIATIVAGCARCDWAVPGREAVLLELRVDGAYSQHLALTRGEEPVEYRVMLGSLPAGPHHLALVRDTLRSAKDAGAVRIGAIDVRTVGTSSPEYPWLSRAPILRARPGTVERFSDYPLLMYAESNVIGERGAPYRYQYTVIFTNEDGGTPTDRLMATWGRTTDIEFVFGIAQESDGAPPREEIQVEGHQWVAFAGPRIGTHPVLWVATDNNMVADHGPDDAIRFAPAPEMVTLDRVSREAVMDSSAWTYAVTSEEMAREGRIDANAVAGSGRMPDPRRYATVEACGDVTNATLAFDIGVRAGSAGVTWYSTDRGDARFRIARGGCFRGGAPLPPGVTPSQIVGLRVRAYTRPPHGEEAPLPPGSGRVVLRRVNRVFMLDDRYVPALAGLRWTGSLAAKADEGPVDVPVESAAREPSSPNQDRQQAARVARGGRPHGRGARIRAPVVSARAGVGCHATGRAPAPEVVLIQGTVR